MAQSCSRFPTPVSQTSWLNKTQSVKAPGIFCSSSHIKYFEGSNRKRLLKVNILAEIFTAP